MAAIEDFPFPADRTKHPSASRRLRGAALILAACSVGEKGLTTESTAPIYRLAAKL